ncbi:MAG: hypothetical protein EBQ80_02105 [Proteobacteria bacterium]|nr:hypothetical protein [Pseudomonadota bacterium]
MVPNQFPHHFNELRVGEIMRGGHFQLQVLGMIGLGTMTALASMINLGRMGIEFLLEREMAMDRVMGRSLSMEQSREVESGIER